MAFHFDNTGDALTFTQRLARENGWSLGFAQRVVEEYRRFLYLALRASHSVTPSDAVDQAWHLHLVYSRSYWDELCAHVLQHPLHHGPTRGGRTEDNRFLDAYEATRDSYRRCFGSEPRTTSGPSRQCASLRRHAGSGWIWPPTGASLSLPCDGRVSVCWGSSGFPVRPSAAHGSTARN